MRAGAQALRGAVWIFLLPAMLLAATAVPLRVTAVVNAKNLVLENGDKVRLAGIQAPNIESAGPDGRVRAGEPLGEEARAALARLIGDVPVTVKPVGKARDRHGRIIADVFDAQGRNLQQEMIRLGMAMVYSFPDTRHRAPVLLETERAARAAGRGIWSDPRYRIITAPEAGCCIGSFKLVAGTVQQVATVRDVTYLNFGEDWRNDFTAVINRRDRKYFKDYDIEALQGETVRVRGWIYQKNGPAIDLSHPEQIEIVER